MELIQANRLSREYINSLPIIRFGGEVIVVTSEEMADEAIAHLGEKKLIGFDTESRPSFTKGKSYPISLVQFSTENTAYLFQCKKTGFPDSLVELLENPEVKKIGVGIKNDIEKMQELRPFRAEGFIDLSTIAAEKGIIQVGLRGLTARYMKQRITKTAQKTNWALPELSQKQQLYAASDAWICLRLYPLLLEDNTDYRQFNEKEELERQERLKKQKEAKPQKQGSDKPKKTKQSKPKKPKTTKSKGSTKKTAKEPKKRSKNVQEPQQNARA